LLPALAQDESIQWRTNLVMPAPSSQRLVLYPRFLLKDRRRAAALDQLSPVLRGPTVAMLIDTFIEDPDNFSALHARLGQFLSLTTEGSEERRHLANVRTLPLHGQRRSPAELAFTGTRDYWGAWKIRISPEGL